MPWARASPQIDGRTEVRQTDSHHEESASILQHLEGTDRLQCPKSSLPEKDQYLTRKIYTDTQGCLCWTEPGACWTAEQ